MPAAVPEPLNLFVFQESRNAIRRGSSTGFATEAGWLGERVQPSRQDEVVVAQPVDRMSPDSDARPAPG